MKKSHWREITLERNPLTVWNVVTPTEIPVPDKCIAELSLERNSMKVRDMAKLSVLVNVSKYMKELHWRETL